MMFAQNTLSETKIQKFTPLSETTSIPAPFKWESPRATCPDHCYKVPESHEAVGCPGHCSFSCETGCPDNCWSLPTVSTLPMCPSECHASCHELCPMHCCKVSSFSISLCSSHCKTVCDHLCPSHCCSQQLTPALSRCNRLAMQFVSHIRVIYTRKNMT